MSRDGIDFYDVTIINGVNMPLSFAPMNGSSRAGNPYFCGSAGGVHAITPNGSAASWQFNPPDIRNLFVMSGGPACMGPGDCDNGEVCGLSNTPGKGLQLTCGALQGYWTADQVCGEDAQFGFPFNCSSPAVNGPTPGATLSTYYGCTDGISSCYSASAPSTCCGCINWWEEGIDVPPAPATEACVNVNSEWVARVGDPQLLWLKRACPSCYVFPFDDMSSTFVCGPQNAAPGGGNNTIAYEVVACPS